MVQADDNSTHPRTQKLTAGEAQSLADRLFSRGVSTLATGTPEQTRDLLIASKIIRALLHEVDRLAARCGDATRLLRNLKIEVEGC